MFGGNYFGASYPGESFLEEVVAEDLVPVVWFGGMYFGEAYGDPSTSVVVPPEVPAPIQVKPIVPRGQVIFPAYQLDTEEEDRLTKQILKEDLEVYSIIQCFLICNN